MQAKTPATPALTKSEPAAGPDLEGAIQDYVRVHQRLHGQKRTPIPWASPPHPVALPGAGRHPGRSLLGAVIKALGDASDTVVVVARTMTASRQIP